MSLIARHTSASVRVMVVEKFFEKCGSDSFSSEATQPQIISAYYEMIDELARWAEHEKFSIALRSAACRELSFAVGQKFKQPDAGGMMTRTYDRLLRAGVDSYQ